MRRRSGEMPLVDRLTALRDAVQCAQGHLHDPALDDAISLLSKAGARTALGEATVVALAGSTGSGKSSLFNALAGTELSSPGVRRPTTGVAHACTWGGEGTGALLDWLEVPRRHAVPDAPPELDGLVLLDLPDHDSTRLENRLEVDRLVRLVDVLVWVMDPQKYADAAVHDTYLAPYAAYAGSLLVVLNQVDRLSEAQREACVTDLRRLLDSEGLHDVPVLAVSARTGLGLDALRAELASRVSARRAASDRLTADVREQARVLARQCSASADGAGTVSANERRALVAALGDAAGVPVVTSAVERSARQQGARRTGWPAVRWMGRLRPDPLARLHVTGDERTRTSLGPASGVEQARVDNALRGARDSVGDDLPEGWRDGLRRVVEQRAARLPDALDRAVAGTDLGLGRAPRWWSLVGALQLLLLVAAVVGGLWLLALVGLAYLQLDDVVPVPEVEGLPVPTLLLVLGLLTGALLAVLVRPLVRLSARRRGRRARKALLARVEQVAEAELLEPLAEERSAYTGFCEAVQRARS